MKQKTFKTKAQLREQETAKENGQEYKIDTYDFVAFENKRVFGLVKEGEFKGTVIMFNWEEVVFDMD